MASAQASPSPLVLKGIPLKNQLRLFFIELIAYWEGRISTSQLMEQFGLSRQQAQAAITQYQTLHPNNLHYCRSTKAHLPAANFNGQFINGNAEQYFFWLKTQHIQPQPSTLLSALTLPSRQVSPIVMRALITAIKTQQRLEVDYVSLSNPNHEGRIIAPHSLCNTGLRWHLRAFCEKSQQYRDFVLSRFRGEPELLGKTKNTQAQDVAWNTSVTVILEADSRLSPQKREVIQHDYAMQNGQLILNTKGCLVNYLLRDLQISTKSLELTPEAQQWVCVNLAHIKPWLFDT